MILSSFAFMTVSYVLGWSSFLMASLIELMKEYKVSSQETETYMKKFPPLIKSTLLLISLIGLTKPFENIKASGILLLFAFSACDFFGYAIFALWLILDNGFPENAIAILASIIFFFASYRSQTFLSDYKSQYCTKKLS